MSLKLTEVLSHMLGDARTGVVIGAASFLVALIPVLLPLDAKILYSSASLAGFLATCLGGALAFADFRGRLLKSSSPARKLYVLALCVSSSLTTTFLLTAVVRFATDDPRKELREIGIQWSYWNFYHAVERRDDRAVSLFVRGGMSLNQSHFPMLLRSAEAEPSLASHFVGQSVCPAPSELVILKGELVALLADSEPV